MKKFIKKNILFFVCVITFLLAFDYFISFALRKSIHVNNIAWSEIFTGELQNDVVIMGSSRAVVQYNVIMLDTLLHVNSYNLGVHGRKIETQILKYDTYRRLNCKPKLIIQNIDFMTIGKDNAAAREQFFPYFYDKTFKQEVVELEELSLADKYIPGFRYAGYLDRILSRFIVSSDGRQTVTKGYYSLEKEWNGNEFGKQAEIKYLQDSLVLHTFDDYLSETKSENIKVIFVYAPLYIGATEQIVNIEGMYQMYDSIARKHDIPILDYNYMSICYDTAYFFNATHLNKKGAELFSAKLAHDIDSLGILK